ncbi:transposase [Streptomyces sp. NPDC005423]|uniref:transposase n=1 Tax=Streptomyces sp. NPDC005423 TaxID=3155343 RepID=UPI0033B1C143
MAPRRGTRYPRREPGRLRPLSRWRRWLRRPRLCGHTDNGSCRSGEGCSGGTEESPYPAEFRDDAVALYRAAGGKRTYAAVAADVGVTGETLRSWVRQADEHAGRGHGRGD